MARAHLDEALALEEELAIARARSGLLGFTAHTKPDFFVNWHHRRICQAVNALEARLTPRELLASWGLKGKSLDRQLANPHPVTKLYAGLTRPEAIDEPMTGLQVMIAPRHGKSEIISRRLPAWWLGRNPDDQIIACSYSADLSSRMNRDVQRIIETSEYESTFEEVRLNSSNVRAVAQGSWLRNSDIFEVVGRRGVYRSAGCGGGITGMGANLALADDVFKNRKQADSPVERQNVWEWYASTLYTRLQKRAAKIIINTRWHEYDLSGRTLAQAMADPDADQWFCLVFPALLDCDPGPGDPRKHGEALWPDEYSAKRLQAIKATAGTYEFEALYQQRPSPQGGGIVKDSWWRYYDRLPANLTNYTLSADLAFKDRGDYCAFQIWASKGAERYLVDQVMRRMEFTEQIRTFQTLCEKYPQCKVKLVEDAANGAALISTLKRSIQGIIAIRPQGSKEARAEAVTPQIEAGNVFLPSPTLRPWVEDFLTQWRNFPAGAFDDAVDAASQALSRMAKSRFDLTAGLPMSIGERQHLPDRVGQRGAGHNPGF